MKIKIPFVLSVISLLFNALFVLLIILSSNSKRAFFSFNKIDGYVASAAIVSFPASGETAFGVFEITLTAGEKAYFQYSVSTAEITQANMAVKALYDPDIVSVKDYGYGIEITALSRGSTLMQTLSNDGIKDVALVIVK